MVVHYLHKVCGTDLAHLALLVIELAHLAVETAAPFHYGLEVSNIVQVAFHTGDPADNGLDLLVAKDGTDATAASLLHPDLLSLGIKESEVQHTNTRMIGC